ncbi:MAG: ATP-grasp domain-containing protein [Promethearchaeota archaeon]
MVRLLEYESKEVFELFGIPVPDKIIIQSNEEISSKVDNFKFPAIIKSQIAIGSRKKAGLIKVAHNKDEAVNLCKNFFTKKVGKFEVEAILIEELLTIRHEYYCSITLDTSGKRFFLIVSAKGGINIEETAISNPRAIIKRKISLKKGLSLNSAVEIAEQLGFSDSMRRKAVGIFQKLWSIAVEKEAQLVEINPLVLTPNDLIAADGKIILEDNAGFRQPLTKKLIEKNSTELEKTGKKFGFSFVELGGNIGILANGAGLTITLLDILGQNDLKPANFLDVGGGASKERVYQALKLIFKLEPKSIFINIFGGITRCDIVAKAIIQTLEEFKNAPPMVIRLTGTRESEGISILKKVGINAFSNMMEAVKKLKMVMEQE